MFTLSISMICHSTEHFQASSAHNVRVTTIFAKEIAGGRAGVTAVKSAALNTYKGKGKGNIAHRRENLTSNALRCGSHSVTCQQHHTCIYP